MSNQTTIDAVTAIISSPRISTYESATGGKKPNNLEALDLYAWNADVSGALLIPLHICEVAIRNAVAEAIENVYGIDGRGLWVLNEAYQTLVRYTVQRKIYSILDQKNKQRAKSFLN